MGAPATLGLAVPVTPPPFRALLLRAEDGPAALGAHTATLRPFSLASQRAAIDYCFGADSMVEVARRLEAIGDSWATQTLATLRTVSPSALCWTVEALRRGANLTLPQCQHAELALTRTTMRHPDFAEVDRLYVDAVEQRKMQPLPADMAGQTLKALAEMTMDLIDREPDQASRYTALGIQLVWGALTSKP